MRRAGSPFGVWLSSTGWWNGKIGWNVVGGDSLSSLSLILDQFFPPTSTFQELEYSVSRSKPFNRVSNRSSLIPARMICPWFCLALCEYFDFTPETRTSAFLKTSKIDIFYFPLMKIIFFIILIISKWTSGVLWASKQIPFRADSDRRVRRYKRSLAPFFFPLAFSLSPFFSF